jgi:hypothetical protein
MFVLKRWRNRAPSRNSRRQPAYLRKFESSPITGWVSRTTSCCVLWVTCSRTLLAEKPRSGGWSVDLPEPWGAAAGETERIAACAEPPELQHGSFFAGWLAQDENRDAPTIDATKAKSDSGFILDMVNCLGASQKPRVGAFPKFGPLRYRNQSPKQRMAPVPQFQYRSPRSLWH